MPRSWSVPSNVSSGRSAGPCVPWHPPGILAFRPAHPDLAEAGSAVPCAAPHLGRDGASAPGHVPRTRRGCPMSLHPPFRRNRIRSRPADLKLPVDSILAMVDPGETHLCGGHRGAPRNPEPVPQPLPPPGRHALPAGKTLADFDFSFHPSIECKRIDSLRKLCFVERKENVSLLGPPSVGETHRRHRAGHRSGPARQEGLLRVARRSHHLIRGNSCRMRGRSDLWRALHPPTDGDRVSPSKRTPGSRKDPTPRGSSHLPTGPTFDCQR